MRLLDKEPLASMGSMMKASSSDLVALRYIEVHQVGRSDDAAYLYTPCDGSSACVGRGNNPAYNSGKTFPRCCACSADKLRRSFGRKAQTALG